MHMPQSPSFSFKISLLKKNGQSHFFLSLKVKFIFGHFSASKSFWFKRKNEFVIFGHFFILMSEQDLREINRDGTSLGSNSKAWV